MAKPLKTVSQETFDRRRMFFHLVIGLISVALVILTYFAKLEPYFPVDLTITRAVQQFHPLWFDWLMRIITFIGQPIPGTVLTLLVATFIYRKGRAKDSLLLCLSVFGIEIIGLILKVLVGRSRPDPRLIHQVYSNFHSDSFPSGHVLYYMGMFGFLLFLTYTLPPKNIFRRFLLFIFALLIILVGPSRIYLGAHWASDVTGAYMIGALWLTLMVFLHNKMNHHL